MKEEVSFDYPRYKAGTKQSVFRVVVGNDEIVRVKAHEPVISDQQPVLRFARYTIEGVEVTVTKGGTKNKTEETQIQEHAVGTMVGAVNAGAWISFFDEDAVVGIYGPDEVVDEEEG